jgi:hypothetical protein
MRERLRAQTGQTAAEYMGVLLLVAAITTAIIAGGIQNQINDGIKAAVCKIAGLECEVEKPPLSECVVSESSDKVTLKGDFNVRFVNVKLEGGVEYVRQTRANGDVAITIKLPTSGGVGPKLSKALGMGGELDVGINDAKAADKFEDQVTESAIAIAAGPIGAHLLGKDVHVDVPPVESVAYELTSGANASIGVDSPGGYANGSIDLGNALGIKKNLTSGKPNSGDITAYYRVEGKLAGEGGLLVGEGAGGGLSADQTLAVTFDSHGKPKGLTLTASGSYEGKLQLNGKFKDLQAALGAINGLDITASQGEGQKIQVQLDLPLDNPDVQNATLAFLRGINPVTGGPVDAAQAAADLKDAILQNATAQVRTYDTNSTTGGAEIDLGVGGGGVTVDSKDANLTGAMDYVPGQGFVPSQVCVVS